MKKIRIASANELAEGQTLKFEFVGDGRNKHGFLARFQGKLLAYENICRHIPLPLDYADNKFFSRDGKHFYCQTHGAIYEPHTGLCVQGPCEGESLKPLKIQLSKEEIFLLLD